MVKKLSTKLTPEKLQFRSSGQPSDQPVCFYVEVFNHSDKFATFQVELQAAGVNPKSPPTWYRLAPDVAAKIPAGNQTRFCITLLDVPPVDDGFTGQIDLQVRVFSIELNDVEHKIVKLTVQGEPVAAPKLTLVQPTLEGMPGDRVEIPLAVYNPNRFDVDLKLQLTGISSAWFPEGIERNLLLSASNSIEQRFLCHIPVPAQAPSQNYAFTIQATVPQARTTQVAGTLIVQPAGHVEWSCDPPEQSLPVQEGDRKISTLAVYHLKFTNQSNVQQPVSATAQHEKISLWELIKAGGKRANAQALLSQNTLNISPEATEVMVENQGFLVLTVQQKRPWWGGVRHRLVRVTPLAATEVRPPTQELKLRVKPRLSVWLQLLLLTLLSCFIWAFLNPPTQHAGSVNTVQFNGLASEVVSASDDTTIRRWAVNRFQLKQLSVLKPARPNGFRSLLNRLLGSPNRTDNPAVRVVRYRPVNNSALAAGLENGETQIWDLRTGQLQSTLVPQLNAVAQKDDRVFDLRYSRDSKLLFAGHGSGRVIQWKLDDAPLTVTQSEPIQVGFAVTAIALVGKDESHLVIGGRSNRLVLWDLNNNRSQRIDYPAGDKDNDYIFSLATAEQKPTLLAVTDNQGRLSFWNLADCLSGTQSCTEVAQDTTTYGEQAISSVALSADACYAATGGVDGQVMLWWLNPDGEIMRQRRLDRAAQPINAVDIAYLNSQVKVVSGGDDRRVKLYSQKSDHAECYGLGK